MRQTDQVYRGERFMVAEREKLPRLKAFYSFQYRRSQIFLPREKAAEADVAVRCPTGRIQVAVLYVFQSNARTARELHESPNTLNRGWRKIGCRDCTPRCCRIFARNLWRSGTCIVDTSFECISKIRYCWIVVCHCHLA